MFPHDSAERVAAIGSMTMAMKAQRALYSRGVAARVTALSPTQSRNGCAYGVVFAAEDERAARAALQAAHIAVSQYFAKDATDP